MVKRTNKRAGHSPSGATKKYRRIKVFHVKTYLIQITQQQEVLVAISAGSEQEAFELVLAQQGKVETLYPPELIHTSCRMVSTTDSANGAKPLGKRDA